MKIYLSGPITNNPIAQQLFADAESRYSAIGDVINPLKVNHPDTDWLTAMRIDIPLLISCDTIVMLDGWKHSRGATLEHHIAITLGLQCIYDSPFHVHDYILNIIEQETGVTIDMIRSQSRKQIIVFARHIAAYLIHQYSNYTLKHIGMILNRDHSSVHFAIRNVDNMLTYRNALHDLFDLVSNKLETIKPKLCTTTSTCCVES